MKPSSLMTTAAATVGLVLAILVTRVEHFGTAFTPADATLAVLFLAGMWIRRAWPLPTLLGAATLADQLALRQGVSAVCVTAAYLFLIPAYACVWWAGRASGDVNWRRPAELARTAGNLLSSLVAAFVAVSRYYGDVMRERLRIDPSRLHVIPIGVDPGGQASCTVNGCGMDCPADTLDCGDDASCTPVNTTSHCGACDHACATPTLGSESCTNHQCVGKCTTGLRLCGAGESGE